MRRLPKFIAGGLAAGAVGAGLACQFPGRPHETACRWEDRMQAQPKEMSPSLKDLLAWGQRDLPGECKSRSDTAAAENAAVLQQVAWDHGTVRWYAEATPAAYIEGHYTVTFRVPGLVPFTASYYRNGVGKGWHSFGWNHDGRRYEFRVVSPADGSEYYADSLPLALALADREAKELAAREKLPTGGPVPKAVPVRTDPLLPVPALNPPDDTPF